MMPVVNADVASPPHYKKHARECIQEMVLLFGWEAVEGFCRCNAWKYRERAPYKGKQAEDDGKADWYIECIDVMKHHDMQKLECWLSRKETSIAQEYKE